MQNSFKIDHFLQKMVSIGKIPGSGKNKSETGSSSSRVTLVVKLLRFLTVGHLVERLHYDGFI